jgi:hypothetical protein
MSGIINPHRRSNEIFRWTYEINLAQIIVVILSSVKTDFGNNENR